MSRGDEQRPAGPIRWPRTPRRPPAAERVPRGPSLLDLDDDLARECDPELRDAAREAATVRLAEVASGPCDLEPWFDEVRRGAGLLVLDGLIAMTTIVGERAACELVGSGDLLQHFEPRADELVAQSEASHALAPTTFALLDAAFATRVGGCPQLGTALLRRAARRAAEAEALRAIASHPRLELRLVLLLWHLASRWGKVMPNGIRLTLPLTHRLLGQLVAAERPSISHAMHRLAQTGLVVGAAGDLVLRGTLDSHLNALHEPLGGQSQHLRVRVAPAVRRPGARVGPP